MRSLSVQWRYNGFHIVIDMWIEKRVLQELLLFNEFRNIKHLVFSLYLSIGAAWSAQWQYNGFHIVIDVWIEKRLLKELILCNEFWNIKHLVYSLYLGIGAACVYSMTIHWVPHSYWRVDWLRSFSRTTPIQWIQKYQASCLLTLPKYRCSMVCGLGNKF